MSEDNRGLKVELEGEAELGLFRSILRSLLHKIRLEPLELL